jgi:hypothetical protein
MVGKYAPLTKESEIKSENNITKAANSQFFEEDTADMLLNNCLAII